MQAGHQDLRGSMISGADSRLPVKGVTSLLQTVSYCLSVDARMWHVSGVSVGHWRTLEKRKLRFMLPGAQRVLIHVA